MTLAASSGRECELVHIEHWRVTTEFADSSTFNQETRIAPIEDGVAVLFHAADAFGLMAVAYEEPSRPGAQLKPADIAPHRAAPAVGWVVEGD